MANLEVDKIRLKSNYYNDDNGETPTVDNDVVLQLDESELGLVYSVDSANNTQPSEVKIVSGPASPVSGGVSKPVVVTDTCDELNNNNGVELHRDSEATSKVGGFNVEKDGLSYSDSESTAKISSSQKAITNFNIETLRSLTIDTSNNSHIFVNDIIGLPLPTEDVAEGTIYFVLGEEVTNNQEEAASQPAAMKAKSTQTINKTKTTKKKTTKGGK